jgi:type II secretory pathway pseudopilin PulG
VLCRRGSRPRAAFTLIEAVVAISITALAGSALMLSSTASLEATRDARDQTIATGLAQQLMDEAMGNRYMEYGTTAYQTTLGPGSDEMGGTRDPFDDVDDFNGVRTQPPKDAKGIPLGTDNGVGGQRHANFQIPASALGNWRQEVDVYYVSASSLTTRLPAGQTSDYRAVEVRIMYTDTTGATRELAKLRRVVAYLPPLP